MKSIRNESGQTLVMVAVSMTILLGFAAFATDIGVMLHEKRIAQSAADSAAIATAAAITQRLDGVTAGITDAALNGFTVTGNCTAGSTQVCIHTTPVDGPFNGQAGYVEAVIRKQTPGFFMRAFGWHGMTITSRAVATYLGSSDLCGGALNQQNAPVAAYPWGNSTIDASHCGVLINGNLQVGASDAISAEYLGVSGSIIGKQPFPIIGDYQEGVPEFTDPDSYLNALPTDNGDGTCTPPADPNNPTAALPACFVNKTLSGTLSPGVYYFTQPATYSGVVTGTGVTIVLKNNSLLSISGSGGKGNACLELSAPKTGFYSGVVIDAPTYTGSINLDFGATTSVYNGLVYMPQADLSLQDQGANGSACNTNGVGVTINGGIIMGTLDIQDKNKGNLTLNGSSAGIPSPFPRISLVE